MAASSVSQTLPRIFADMPLESLVWKGPTSRETSTKAKKEAKRLKHSPPELLLRLEIILLVAEILDPLELLAWSGCCRDTRSACSLAVRLSALFSFFRIHKWYADVLHDTAKYSWRIVYKLLIASFRELQKVYGPYEIHPLHAAAAGEALIMALLRRVEPGIDQRGPFSGHLTISSHVGNLEYTLFSVVIGEFSDFFIREAEGSGYSELWEECADIFPDGPAKHLEKAGCTPLIPIFKRTHIVLNDVDQFGIFFPIVKADGEGDIKTYTTQKDMQFSK